MEEDQTKKAAIFEEGHYAYFELVGKLKSSNQPELANKFMQFVLSGEFQSLIPFTNWSYPAAQDRSKWPEVFHNFLIQKKHIFWTKIRLIRCAKRL